MIAARPRDDKRSYFLLGIISGHTILQVASSSLSFVARPKSMALDSDVKNVSPILKSHITTMRNRKFVDDSVLLMNPTFVQCRY